MINQSAIIAVDKPKDITSYDVIRKLKKKFGIKKIGHAGTLDPLATGVLPICTGKYTRLVQFFKKTKRYTAEIMFGIETDSYDITGKILSQCNVTLTQESIEACLGSFTGKIEQEAPLISAVNYKGKRLYKYGREGITIEDLPKRLVYIDKIEPISFKDGENPTITLDITCSQGTYIRSIAHDLGKILGCGACILNIRRTLSSDITLDDAVTLEKLLSMDETVILRDYAISPLQVMNYPVFHVSKECIKIVKNGGFILANSAVGTVILTDSSKNILAVGQSDGEKIVPKVNLL